MNNRLKRWASALLAMFMLMTFVQLPNLNVSAASPQLSNFALQQVGKSIVLKLDSSSTLVNTVKKPLDSSSNMVKPLVKNNTTFVPLRFLSENLGAKVTWDQKSQTASVAYGSKTIKAAIGQKRIKINNTYQSLAAPTFQISGRVYVPLRVISETFGKNVYYSSGIIILSNVKPSLDSSKEQQLVGELIGWFSSTDGPELTVRQLVEKYDDSVVTIYVNDFYGQTVAQGSGFYIGNGLFLTNNHVLDLGYSYDLLLNNGQEMQTAGVVAYDKDKDLAILKAKSIPNLKPVVIGSKNMVQKGDRIVTIGSPMGLTNTVSDGLVSGFRVDEQDVDLIQITAPITHGSSGSPLFNMYGFVVGVNTLGYEESGNLNFAVAIDYAAPWLTDYLTKNFSSLSVMNQTEYLAQGGSAPSSSEMPQAPIDYNLPLDFTASDAVKDPTKPVIFIADKIENKIYKVNYETKEVQSISFAYKPEAMDYYNGALYVALPKQDHNYYTDKPLYGVIATIDAESFEIKDQFDIDMDPFDIVAGHDGNVYVTSGSNQWTDIAAYSLSTKARVSKQFIRHQSYAVLNPVYNKIYTVSTDVSPRDINAFVLQDGAFTKAYDSPYHGDYPLGTKINISPDGRYLFNNKGSVFLTGSSYDLTYAGKLSTSYTDIAFDAANNKIYTGSEDGLISVHDYKTFSFQKVIRTKGNIQFLFYDKGKLIAVTKDDNPNLNKVRYGIMIEDAK